MLLSEFEFPFDPALIADRPVEPRDYARLLTLTPAGISHRHRIVDLPELLLPRDLLVVNDTKVLPVRLTGRKVPGGGNVEVLFIRDLGEQRWDVLLKDGGKVGQVIELPAGTSARVVQAGVSGTIVTVSSPQPMHEVFAAFGQMPLPPYIKRRAEKQDRDWYQTIFARHAGAVAAPTAGLHFTDRVLTALQARGIGVVTVTLHVGPGTFRPVKVDRIDEHRMEAETIEVSAAAAEAIAQTKARDGRVVAVGTTVVRTLEGVARLRGQVTPYRGATDLFITPGHAFRVVDVLLTNFHLPRSTLLMLTAAFAGYDRLKHAYAEAVAQRYRFYSYGDAMLIVK